VHLESDWFFRFIAGGYVDPWRPEAHAQNSTVMQIVSLAAASYTRGGYWTVVDGIVIPGWFFEPLRDSLTESGIQVAYAVLRVPLETAVERSAGRDPDDAPDPRVVERLWNDFSALGELERHVIEVGDRSPEETAAIVAERLDAGDLAA
jgi:hypothetical protein